MFLGLVGLLGKTGRTVAQMMTLRQQLKLINAGWAREGRGRGLLGRGLTYMFLGPVGLLRKVGRAVAQTMELREQHEANFSCLCERRFSRQGIGMEGSNLVDDDAQGTEYSSWSLL